MEGCPAARFCSGGGAFGYGCVAEVIRQAVDSILRSPSRVTTAERRARAIAAAGRFRSGLKDLSKGHDRYLAEAFRR